MSEKEFLELLIELHGLTPIGVENYVLESHNASEIGHGYRGKGLDEFGDVVISFDESEGFKAAVSEILLQVRFAGLVPQGA